MNPFRAILMALGLFALAVSAQAQTLYAATAAGGEGRLYILDPASGAVVQDLGALNDAAGVNYGVTGLAYDPVSNLLFGSVGNAYAFPARLLTIDPATAQVTVIGEYNAGNPGTRAATMADLATDPTTGALFGVGSVGGPQLYSINKATGQATLVGSTGLTSTTGGGLAIDSAGRFFGTPTSSRFGTYDSLTGAYTNIANPVKYVGGGYAALAFNGAALYGVNLGSGNAAHLVTIDPATGVTTDLGATVTNLDAIAFVPSNGGAIPEPGTLALLLGPGALALLRRRRK